MNNKVTYTLQIDAEISSLVNQINTAKKAMSGLGGTAFGKDMERQFGTIDKAIERLQQKASTPITSQATFGSMYKDIGGISASLKNLMGVIDSFGNAADAEKLKILPPDQQAQIQKAMAALVNYTNAVSQAGVESTELANKRREEAAASDKLEKAIGKLADKQKILSDAERDQSSAKAALDSAKQKVAALEAQEQAAKDAAEEFKRVSELYESGGGDKRKKSDFTTASGEKVNYQDSKRKMETTAGPDPAALAAAKQQVAELEKAYSAASSEVTRYGSQVKSAETSVKTNTAAVDRLQNEVVQLENSWKASSAKDQQAAFDNLRASAQQLGVSLDGIGTDASEANVQTLTQRLNELRTNGLDQATQATERMTNEVSTAGVELEKTTTATRKGEQANADYNKTASDTQAMANRIKQFVGIQGAAMIARRAMRAAMDTIKELDATMTEMAVVTNLEIGDYWNQLADHTARANELGLAINDVYKAETLYYQQGLKTEQVVAMSTETLKMARIAGLEAEDATNKMTAALRGFNMELNETSAQKVADVYSELAAITASDVDEISTAMTKTASIASNAGMEFETTAAFLSQIIETTRESAETAGTAMKTVIARFQELKKDPAEIGEVDGEVVDANKIEGALRTVGVSLRDASGQFRELDDVFLELASKWDGLDTNTQRYIATIAAGSRQQSRFIAMMSDYGRTQELVTAANNSAGASQEQYEKTLSSLETALNRLKNSWDTFVMGIMDNELLKAGIGILNALLSAINSIVGAFDKIGLGSVASIGMIVGALYLGDKALKTFLTTLGESKSVFASFGAVGKGAVEGVKNASTRLTASFYKVGVSAKTAAKSLNQASSPTFLKAQQAYNKALEKEQGINSARYAARQKINSQQGTSATLNQHYAATEDLASKATADRIATEGALYAAMELTDNEKKEAAALSAAGVSADTAAILAKTGITAANVAEYASTNNLTEAEAAEIMVSKLGQKATLQETVSKLLNTVAKKLGAKATLEETKAKGANTVATWLQTAANWALNASMGLILLVILAVVAAIVLLVGIVLVLVAAFKTWKANSPEGRMEALREKTEAAKEAAEEATNAYKDLVELHDSYVSLTTDVENLTEGTTAWKEAVVELNEKIAELLELYPQLAKYISFTKNGVMQIEEAGWDELLNQQASKARLAKANQYYQENRQNREAAEQTKDSQDKNAKKLKNKGRKLYSGKNVNEVDWMVQSLQYDDWGSETYNKRYSQLQELFAEDKQMLEIINEMNDAAKNRTDLENQANANMKMSLWSLGSEAAQQDQNYGRIINSLAPYYDYDSGFASDMGKASAYKWQEGSTIFWNEGSNSSNAYLQAELAKHGLISSKNEKYDMAALLAAKGGTAYTKDQIDDMNKKADDNLSKELDEIYGLEKRGKEVVDEIYNLSQTDSLIGELYGGSLEADLDAIDEHISENYFGKDGLTRALQQRIEDIRQARADVDLELQKIYDNEQLTALEFTGSYDSAQKFILTYNEMLSSVGGGLATSFADLFAGFDVEQQQSFFDQYGNVNWSSSIKGAATLKEMLEGNNVALQKFAIKALALESATYSATAQMNEFYQSLSPDTLSDLASDGEIAATEILELAKTNEDLALMLDNTGVSAAALGHYYKLLEERTISTYEATEEFIRALSDLNAASNTIEDTFGFIDTFEPSRSQTEIGDYFGEMRESLFSLYDMGAYGDQQLQDYLEAFLGDNWTRMIEENNGDMKAAMDQAITQINSYGDNLYGAWQKLAEQGLQGVSMGENGAINFDMEAIGDVDTLKQNIIDMGWSEAMADALIADAQTFSTDLATNLDQLGLEQAFTSWLQGAMTINGKTIIPKGQVEAMAKELNTSVEDLTKKLKDQGFSVMELVTADGLLGKDMRDEIIEQINEAGEFDLEGTYKMLLDLGLEDKEAKAELKSMAKSLENVPVTINGETIEGSGKVLYDATGAAMETASTTGLIEGLEDPALKAAQQLSAIEQGNMMAKANATGSIVASRIALQSTAQGIDNLINGITGVFRAIGINIPESNLAGTVAGGTEAMIVSAENQIDGRNASWRRQLQNTINAGKTSDNDYSKQAGALADIYGKEMKEIVSSYEDKNAQEVGTYASEEDEHWENPYDEIYNLNKDINGLLRKRNKLEQEYERGLKKETASAVELFNNRQEQLNLLELEKKKQEELIEAAQNNIISNRRDNSDYRGLYSVDALTGEVYVNHEAAEARFKDDADAGQEFEEFISALEEQYDIIKEAEDRLYEIEEDTDEIENRGKDQLEEIYDSVKEAIIAERQAEIDELQNISDSVQEMQDAIVNRIQEQIDDQRQQREDEKTEKELQDKQNRLSYLMMDTSGANDLEIAALQEEIATSEESYQDSLVDQALEELQNANEKAAEQRQQQIDIAQAQLDSYAESKVIWDEVKTIVNDSLTQVLAGKDFSETEAGKLIIGNMDEDNPFATEDFITELNTSAIEAASNLVAETKFRHQVLLKYKSGGLANFTGPAWLDGTPSRPEYVLNADQTARFFELIDVLGDLDTKSTTSEKRGDNYFDIQISVESIEDDYDVEQLADKIRSMIYDDATYRNVNAIHQIR